MEIKLEIPFNPEQVSMLDMHSVLNVLNVVQYELLNLSTELDDPDELMGLIQATAAAGLELSHPERALEHVRAASDFAVQVNTVLDGLEEKLNLGQDQGFQATRRNLNGIFTVLKVRAQEIIDRTDNPGKRVTYGLEKLKFNFEQVLHSIEKNSKGAYGIVYNIAQHHEGDYLVHLDFDSSNGKTKSFPPIFQDVMRDLIANARKYTVPGGKINAGLFQDEKELRFIIEDSGRGIPEKEIEQVVYYGARGSNVSDRPTRGGGFGLTKAYYVCKMYGGRMWIESPINTESGGTRIKLVIPNS